MRKIIECVPNISEGRNLQTIAEMANAIERAGATILHTTSDADHNRSVITFAGEPDAVADAALSITAIAVDRIDLNRHRGIHPRLGALDVLPFIPVSGATLQDSVDLAHAVGKRIWGELRVPIYFYEAAALRSDRRKLEDVRRGQFEGLRESVLTDPAKQPDIGGPGLHLTAGACIVGARKFLIAFNINLQSQDLELAKRIAATLRERNGGLPGVKALGLPLHSHNLVQVSMNITDFQRTPVRSVYDAVAKLAAESGVDVAESELIGLAPAAAISPEDADYMKIAGWDESRILERRSEITRLSGGPGTGRKPCRS